MIQIGKDKEKSENLDRNRSPPSSPPPSNHSSESPPPMFNLDLSHHFEILKITITSCLTEVKTVSKILQACYTQTHGNLINHSLKKKEVKKSNMYLMHMKH